MNDQINSTPATAGVWKKLFHMFYRPQKKLVMGVIVLALITASIEATFALVTKAVVDDIVANGVNARLLEYGLIFFAMVSGLVLCIWAFIRLAGRLSMNLMYSLRKQSFEHLQTLSFSFFDTHAVGWLVARVTSDCARIARLIAWGTLDLFWGVPLILGIFVVLFILEWKLALLVMSVAPLMAIASVYFNKKILVSSRKVRRTNSRITAVYNESIAGVETSKILVREEENQREFEKDTQLMFGLSMQNLMLSATFYPIITLFVAMGTGIALWGGGQMVLGSVITLGTLVAFMSYTRTLMDPILEVAEVLTNLQRTTVCAERVVGLLAVEPEIKDDPQLLDFITNSHADNSASHIESIEFKDVTFEYKPNEPVLKGFNLKVNAGETIALVGATGSGKSTIVSLLCRFYEPSTGQILLNNEDYKQQGLHWLQSNLGIVLQTPFLFSGTIKSNIRYGKLDATDEEVIAAAKAVNVHDIIMSMEDGYDTAVMEGGSNLSTGQKQLISFARAVIGDPQILVMDEATSSVDTQTEHLLQQSLQAVLKGRTSFVIAHRLSTIRSADKILVIDQGELKEAGSHEALLAEKGRYFELYQKQFQSEQESELLG